MVRLFFATSFEIYSASQFYLSLVTGLDVTQNISTAESPDTLATIYMIPFKYDDFKKLCYQIEAIFHRSWSVDELSGENYPKTFYYCKFSNGDVSKTQILLLCNNVKPLFAFIDPSKVDTFDFFASGFIQNEAIEEVLATLLNNSQIPFKILGPKVLLLEFNGESDFNEKLKDIGFSETDIALIFETLRPDLFNFKLFHGRNIGLDLFNSEDD